jgi:hypothetical protein
MNHLLIAIPLSQASVLSVLLDVSEIKKQHNSLKMAFSEIKYNMQKANK